MLTMDILPVLESAFRSRKEMGIKLRCRSF